MLVKNTAQFVAEEIRASVFVLGKGSNDAMRARDRRGVGRGIRAEHKAAQTNRNRSPLRASSTGLTGGLLALTAAELVLLGARAGFVGRRATDELDRRPLAEIHGASFDAAASALRILLAEDALWEFDIARRDRADAQLLASAIGHRS